MPAVLTNPGQIVTGFTYGGAVAELRAVRNEGRRAPLACWPDLRRLVSAQVPLLTGPHPEGHGLCSVCHGPARRGSPRCYPCDLHVQCGGDGLADVVVPVAFAVKGSPHARHLWQYKSPRLTAAGTASPAVMLRALLPMFLRDHGACLWTAAGITGPTHMDVVPTARGRLGRAPAPRADR